MRDQTDKSVCSRVTETLFKAFLVASMLALLGIFYIQHHVASHKYLISPEKKNVLMIIAQICLVLFSVLYIVMSGQVFCRYRTKRKICSFTNCIFSSVSILIIVFSVWILRIVFTDRRKYTIDFEQRCEDIQQILDNTSAFQEAD